MSRNYFYSTFAPSSFSLSLFPFPPLSSFSRSRRHRGKGTRKVGSHKLNLPVTIHSREKSTRIFEATSANLLNLRTREKFLERRIHAQVTLSVSITQHRIHDLVSPRPFDPLFETLIPFYWNLLSPLEFHSVSY